MICILNVPNVFAHVSERRHLYFTIASHIGDIITKPETIIKIFMWSQSRMHMGDDARMMCDEDSRARHVSCFHKTYRLDRNKLTEINCMLFIL